MIGERVRAVEVHVEQLLEDGLRREEKQEEILVEVKKLSDTVGAIQDELNKYKGFLGGIIWLATAMGVAIYKLAGPLYEWFKMKSGN